MISIIVLIHNTRQMAADCLQSLLAATQALRLDARAVEFVLIDDCSDDASNIPALLKEFRALTEAETQMVRFRRHSHYAYGVAVGLSLARGENVLFVSHDMIVPPACLAALLEVSAMHPSAGIIRPRSQHMDGADKLQLTPPLRSRTVDDVNRFAQLVRKRFGGEMSEQWMCIGDAMLVKRAVLDRIGVFDTRFFGFLSDVDYGLRAQRAGFKVVTAHSAWLHHLGDGFTKAVELAGGDWKVLQDKKHADVAKAYEIFRAKWGESLPRDWVSIRPADFEKLRAQPRGSADEFQAPLELDAQLCEVMT